MNPYLVFGLSTVGVLLAAAGLMHILSRIGGRALAEAASRAPLLDAVVFFFTHGPWIAAWIVATRSAWREETNGWSLFGVAVLAQCLTLFLWGWLHEAANPPARKGPRIVSTLNRRVGFARNHLAVWWTALAVPVFTLVRLGELIIYPPLTWLVRLPKYRTGEWVNVSRQKFSGLVGYDLIWCLYCDWMTGVWSLGSEMLRNVESFWCPLRFSSPEKCANCAIDFPDVDKTWVAPPPEGSPEGMAKVAALLESQYPGPGGVNAWHGHPVRLTREGRDIPRS
ncbi:MAG TPA: hypothetical protein VD971_02845 [Phycisphaerales bacterium]|nr:hypothetical protein [Phycisphaerales bacterium]